METKVTVVYECKKCGTEVTVNTDGLKSVDPIYCCGNPLFKRKKAAGSERTWSNWASSQKRNLWLS